jgi:hypothetical protein
MFLKAFLITNLLAAAPQDFLWKNRVILVKDASTLEKQLEVFKDHRKGFEERKLVVLQYPMALKEKGVCCTLLGLDGEIKAKSSNIFPKKFIFELIDSMPMRQAELKRNSNPEKKN